MVGWLPHRPTPTVRRVSTSSPAGFVELVETHRSAPELVEGVEGQSSPPTGEGLGWSERTLWLWFGVLFVLSLFFVDKPRTHVYVFFVPWGLLAGMTVTEAWETLRARGSRLANGLGGAVAILLIALFGSYAYWYFVYNQVEIYRTWTANHPAGFWTVYQQPDDRSLFGFPLQNGWKTVGMLYAAGVLHGSYETNDVDPWVTDRYVQGVDRCLRDHHYFILADSLERKSQACRQELLKKLQQDYQLFGTVLVNGQPRLQIYQRGGAACSATNFCQ